MKKLILSIFNYGENIMFISLILFIILIALLLIFIIQSFLFYDISLNPYSSKNTLRTDEDLLEYEKDLSWLDKKDIQDIYITSIDGLRLHAFTIKQPGNLWAILCHGYTSSAEKMAYQAEQFYNMGYSILIPDARGHGKSEGRYIGMGWHERVDMTKWIEKIIQYQSNAEIVLYGISMGGATVLMTSGEALPNNVKAIIEDCGYSSIKDEFSYVLNHYIKIPAFPLLQITAIHTKIRTGFNFLTEGNAVNQVKKAKTPILFIHGKLDTFVPYSMFQKLYGAASTQKQSLIIPEAGHAESCIKEPELYWDTIFEFLKKYIRNP